MSADVTTLQNPFSAVERSYGIVGTERLKNAHVCVVGIGGVGSWAAEALARSGIGAITLIDPDDISVTNINRQVHADYSTLEQSKVENMAARIALINPACRCTAIDDMLVSANIDRHIGRGFDFVIDAIDTIRFKADLIFYCRRNRIPVISVGGAGGKTDPLKVTIADLNKTWNDPLAAKVRKKLRSDYQWTNNSRKRFGVECVFSTEQSRYPDRQGAVSYKKPGVPGATLDCDSGYGSLVTVTAVFGLLAASRVLNRVANVAVS